MQPACGVLISLSCARLPPESDTMLQRGAVCACTVVFLLKIIGMHEQERGLQARVLLRMEADQGSPSDT